MLQCINAMQQIGQPCLLGLQIRAGKETKQFVEMRILGVTWSRRENMEDQKKDKWKKESMGHENGRRMAVKTEEQK